MNKKFIAIVIGLSIILITGGVVANGFLTRDLVGTMEYVDLEGGFWAINSDGQRYVPLNLDDKYKVEGLQVRFEVVERPDLMGIHMSGTYVEILGLD